MMLNFAESGHPAFRVTNALERGESGNKEKGKKSVHFNGSEETIELILGTIIFCEPSSVSSEQSQICAKNWIQIQEIKPKVRFVNLW